MPPCRLLPHPPSRYLNPRPQKCAEQTSLSPQGLCLSRSPLCLLATNSSVCQCQWQHCVLSLCTAPLASACCRSCRCPSSVPRQQQVGSGGTRTLQLLDIQGASAPHLERNATLAAGTFASSFTGFNPCSPSTCWQRCGWHTWLCGLVSRIHQGTISGPTMACNEGMGHRQGEPWA